jgi:IclR family pca regulon transcriptional regulator
VNVNDAPDPASDPNFMQSLARGLQVLRLFEGQASLSMVEAARLTGLSRAVARRCLHTLEVLGYVAADAERRFHPTPAMLALSQAYLAGDHLARAADPVLQRISVAMGESCSLGVRDGEEVVYVARAEVRRLVSIDLQVGSRLPCYCTSMGRVLLAAMPEAELDARLARARLVRRTEHTITDRQQLKVVLDEVRAQGFATIDEEMEVGLRSIAVPVRDASGQVRAALNLGTAREHSVERLVAEVLPVLRAAALELQVQAG